MSPAALAAIVRSPDPGTPRILFVSHCAQWGGAELILCDLVRDFFPESDVFLFEDGPVRIELRAAGVDPTVGRGFDALLEIRRDDPLKLDLACLHAISRGIIQLAQMARRHELVYANSQKAFIIAALATVLVRRPLVWHLHDVMTTEHFGTKQLRLAIGLANLVARRVIVPSKAVADAFCAVGGRREKLRVVPNGISVPAGTRSLDRHRLRAELGLPEGFLISVVGRLDPEKGQHVMLEALALLPDVQCLIIGDAMFGKHDYKEQLQRLVDSLGLRSRVRFLGHRTDVPRLMRASDVVVQTSVRPESFSRVIVEAMLCGTLIAAPREGGALDILTGELGALFYPPGDSGALANLLRSLQHGGQRTAQLAELGAKRAERYFSVPRMQRDVNSVIREILGARQ
jgi:glycosyltransferase involved in cell wall biosynthesis